MAEVANVWSVGPATSDQPSWDIASIKKLGGPKVLAIVWASLKGSCQARYHKRPADDGDYPSSTKRFKQQQAASIKSGTNNSIVATPSIGDLPSTCAPMHPSTPKGGSIPPTNSRQRETAYRKSLIHPSKIHNWLSGMQQLQEPATTKDQVKGVELPSSDNNTAATTCKKRSRRRKTKKANPEAATTPNPSPIPNSSRRPGRRKTTDSLDLRQRSISSYVIGDSPTPNQAVPLVNHNCLWIHSCRPQETETMLQVVMGRLWRMVSTLTKLRLKRSCIPNNLKYIPLNYILLFSVLNFTS